MLHNVALAAMSHLGSVWSVLRCIAFRNHFIQLRPVRLPNDRICRSAVAYPSIHCGTRTCRTRRLLQRMDAVHHLRCTLPNIRHPGLCAG